MSGEGSPCVALVLNLLTKKTSHISMCLLFAPFTLHVGGFVCAALTGFLERRREYMDLFVGYYISVSFLVICPKL